ncbi:hypothetical protein [Streptomyces melanogenes]|uniref:hypothetical protein n=1 Tax=Streptomyces melanogenes TaxID=67326 RepID=UPI0019B8A1E3|nr:hypothetical protein [Streptomyces melanogenes]GGP71996.1 hypothetical protein GCM10010278_57520 [Streptomyces melanogenes]
MVWNSGWFTAIQKASTHAHAFVQRVNTVNRSTDTIFEHVEGGGLCKGCWKQHENTHADHVLDELGVCLPCVEAQQRRGPLTRTPSGREFMCEPCRDDARSMHVVLAYIEGRDPNPRLYRPEFDIAREDAETASE